MLVLLVLCSITISSIEGMRRLPNDDIIGSHKLESRRLNEDAPKTIPQSTTRITSDDPNPDSHLVTSMPLLPDGVLKTRHWAGHLPAKGDGSDKKLFYWLFEPGEGAANIPDNDIPLILWINGGPGCSSMDGLWLENGPLRLQLDENNKWTIGINEHSWHNAPAWTLYVDQPVGTGLSFSKDKNYCKNDFEVSLWMCIILIIELYFYMLTSYTHFVYVGKQRLSLLSRTVLSIPS